MGKLNVKVVDDRKGGIDFFRVFSMLMVVVLHVLGHGGVLSLLNAKTSNWFVLGGLESICIIAVNCFALTTGFLYVGRKAKINSILNLYLQVLFFSLGVYICFLIFGNQPFKLKTFLSFLFPLFSGRYWYFSAYFILFLMIPLLNLILENVNKHFLCFILIMSLFIFGVFPFVGSFLFEDNFNFINGYSFIWLAILYLFGGAIKKYKIYSKLSSKKWLIFYFLSAILSFMCGLVLSALRGYNRAPYISDYTFVFNILSSCLLLMFFASVQIKSNKIIAFFAKNSFGVYLFHEHVFIRETFILNKFTFISGYSTFFSVLIIFAIAVGIYFIGTTIEFIRKIIFKLIKVNKLTEKIEKKIIGAYNNIINKID